MPTKYFNLQGVAKWVKNHTPDEKYQNYTIDLYMDDKTMEVFKTTGLRLQPKEDDEGTYVRFRRPVTKLIKGEAVNFGPPKTIGRDGADFPEVIGNGSTVEVTVVVYDTIKGPGHRLEKIKVLDHIPYERESAQSFNDSIPTSSNSSTSQKVTGRPF